MARTPDQKLKSADYSLRKRFGIPLESRGGPPGYAGVQEYERMLLAQGTVCAICLRPAKGTQRFAVDHSHQTGKIRGLLCAFCNHRVLGRLERARKLAPLCAIARYLERFDPQNELLKT